MTGAAQQHPLFNGTFPAESETGERSLLAYLGDRASGAWTSRFLSEHSRMSARSARAVRVAIGGLCLVAVATLTYARLFFGVDFTDESYYIAVPLRFAMGARPLIDETSLVQQTSGLLLYPFFKIYISVFGFDGIVLFARHLHLLFSAAIAAAIFAALRPVWADVLLRSLLASAAVVCVPFGIHGLSYNTFGAGFLAAGMFLGFAWLFDGRRRYIVTSGLAQGLAVFVYPPLAIAVTCSFAVIYVSSRHRVVRGLRTGVLTTAVIVMAAFVFFIHEGFATLLDILDKTQVYGEKGGGIAKVGSVASFLSATFTQKAAAFIALILLFFCYRWRRQYAFIPLLALLVIALPLGSLNESWASNAFVTNFALFGPVVFLLVRHEQVARVLFAVVWLPSAVAGFITAYSSANGGPNLGIGLFPASVATLTLLALAIQRVGTPVPGSVREIAAVASTATFVSVCLAMQYLNVYRDAPIGELTTRVRGGAFSGLLTTPDTRASLEEIETDLRAVSGKRCSIVFYDTFPAGYLLDAGKGLTNETWLGDVPTGRRTAYQALLIEYYARNLSMPDVVVRVSRVPLGNAAGVSRAYLASEPRELLFAEPRYAVVRERQDYTILRRANANCHSG